MVSQSTLYRLVDYNCLDAINLDLKRKVRYKPRRKKKQFKVDKACKIGRSHKDYLAFRMEHPELRVVHLDTVEGKKGGKVLLTVFFEGFSMMLAYLRESNDSQSVINIIDRLYIELSPSLFTEIMPILLCDNGSEFSNPTALEFDGQGNRRTHVFYCDSQAPHQRPDSERNHSFIRDFSPKGKSMDHLSQSDVQLMMDNINSYSRGTIAREICDVKSAYDMFSFYYGENILNVLGCKRIPSDNVTLNSSIWKNQNNVEQNLFLDSEPEVTT
jgi:IS30 family transposase